MHAPDDPLAPLGHAFAEPWHAQVLAMAHSLICAGHLAPDDWAEALGAKLREAEATGLPDTEETYYQAALDALEHVAPLDPGSLFDRKQAWSEAYLRTPHGQPVVLE